MSSGDVGPWVLAEIRIEARCTTVDRDGIERLVPDTGRGSEESERRWACRPA